MLTVSDLVFVPLAHATVHTSGVLAGCGIWNTNSPDVPVAESVKLPFVAEHVDPEGYVTAIYAHAEPEPPPPTFVLPIMSAPHFIITIVGIVIVVLTLL